MDKVKSEKKNQQIEYIRAIATIGVVSIHTIYSGILYSGDNTVPYVELFFTMVKNSLYWAVPCFGMISGMLLLNPEKELTYKKIYGKYLIRIVLVLLLFGTAFSWIELVFNEHTISMYQILPAILSVLKHQTWEHLWYLYALLTIYIALPVWRIIARKSNDTVLIGIICILYVFNSREINLHQFFLMGELFRRRIEKADKKRAFLMFGCSSFIILVIVYIHEAIKIDLNWLLGYTSIFVAIQSYALFSLFYLSNFNVMKDKIKGAMLHLSEYSFGVYIVHMFFVNLEYKVFNLHLMNSLLSNIVFALLIIVNVIISYLVSVVMKSIPGIKKLI